MMKILERREIARKQEEGIRRWLRKMKLPDDDKYVLALSGTIALGTEAILDLIHSSNPAVVGAVVGDLMRGDSE